VKVVVEAPAEATAPNGEPLHASLERLDPDGRRAPDGGEAGDANAAGGDLFHRDSHIVTRVYARRHELQAIDDAGRANRDLLTFGRGAGSAQDNRAGFEERLEIGEDAGPAAHSRSGVARM